MQALRIGPWTLWPAAARLEGDGRQQHLTPQQLALLLALARAPQQTLGKAALFEQVWPGKVVSDDALTRAISDLRKLLRHAADGASPIRTLHGFGYRLDAEVVPAEQVTAPLPDPVGDAAQAASSGWRRRAAVVALVAAALGTAGTAWLLRARPAAPQEAWAAVPRALALDLPAGLQVVAGLSDASRIIALRVDERGSAVVERRPGQHEQLLARRPGRIALASAAPDERRLAFVHRAPDGRCSIEVLALAERSVMHLVDCDAGQDLALNWRDGENLTLLHGDRPGHHGMLELPLDGSPTARRLELPGCGGVEHLAHGRDGALFVSCRSADGSGRLMLKLRGARATRLFAYRSIGRFAVDARSNVYMHHEPSWKDGITRYDSASGRFAFAHVGAVVDLAVVGAQLRFVRETHRATAQRFDLATGAVTPLVGTGSALNQALAVDAGSGSVWQIDDRRGPLTLFRDDRPMALPLSVDLARVGALAVDETARRLSVTIATPSGRERIVLALSPADASPAALLSRTPVEAVAAVAAGCDGLAAEVAQRLREPCGRGDVHLDPPRARLYFRAVEPPWRDLAALAVPAVAPPSP